MIDVTMNKRDECWWADGCDPSVFLGDAICRAAKRRVDGLPDGKYRVRIEPDGGGVVNKLEIAERIAVSGQQVTIVFNTPDDACRFTAMLTTGHGVELVAPSYCRPIAPKPAPARWPWPDVTRCRISSAEDGGTREVIVCGHLLCAIGEHMLGRWPANESRIASRGPNNEVVLTCE